MAIQVSKKASDWLPQVIAVVLGFVLPIFTPVVRDGIISFIESNPEWATVVGSVVAFVLNVLPSPLTISTAKKKK